MTGNVVKIFSDDDKQQMLWYFSVMGDAFFINASRLACRTLAVALRDLTRDCPDALTTLGIWAGQVENRARERRRRAYYPHELEQRIYYTYDLHKRTPASG